MLRHTQVISKPSQMRSASELPVFNQNYCLQMRTYTLQLECSLGTSSFLRALSACCSACSHICIRQLVMPRRTVCYQVRTHSQKPLDACPSATTAHTDSSVYLAAAEMASSASGYDKTLRRGFWASQRWRSPVSLAN